MLLIWGSRLYGRIHDVAGLFHVATRFGHIYYIPLLPDGSYAVFKDEDGQPVAVKIRFRIKSWLTAWLRALLSISVLSGAIISLVYTMDPKLRASFGWDTIAIPLIALIALVASYRLPWFRKASYAEAVMIREEIGLAESLCILIDAAYGVISDDEARQYIEALRQRDEAADTSDDVGPWSDT